MENPLKTVRVSAEKAWRNTDNTEDLDTHPTIWFQLYRQSAAQTQPAAVGEPVELAEGMTEAAWDGLPEYDVFGNAYAYFVREVDAEGTAWTPPGYAAEEEGLTVINRKRSAEVVLKKADPNGEALAGAVFELTVEVDGVFMRQDGLIAIDSADGAAITGLEPGRRYRLEEKQAPDGFVFTEKYTYFSLDEEGKPFLTDAEGSPSASDHASVSENGLALTVTNAPGAALPATGGPGRHAWTPLALLLLAAAAVLAVRRRRSLRPGRR